MNILAVDDEQHALNILEKALKTALPDGQVAAFASPRQALEFARTTTVDVAFLDIEMGSMNGLELALALKKIYGRTNIIFVTGYSEYALDAFSIPASGYVTKPVSADEIGHQMENLRHPLPTRAEHRVRVQTFGSFEVFADGAPIVFRRTKSKEILAYLVDRKGAGVTKKELAAILWEDGVYTRTRQYHLQTLITGMFSDLAAVGAKGIVIKKRNFLALDTTKVDCDLYRFLDFDIAAVNAYTGEYMANYSWAEFTTGMLGTRKLNYFT